MGVCPGTLEVWVVESNHVVDEAKGFFRGVDVAAS